MPPTPAGVRRRYYAIVGLFNLSASLIWGINTLFLLGAGLDLFETFVANAFFTAGQVLFEIPTGVVADTVGRRFSFIASVFVLFIGTLAYVGLAEVGAGVFLFSLASILLGLGFTFYSGAVEAWLVDALHATGFDGPVDAVFARGGQVFGLSLVLGTVGGGLLGQLDLSYPYLVRALLLAILFGVAWWGMHDVGFEQRPFRWRKVPREMRSLLATSLDDGWRRPPVRLLMLITLLQMGFLMWGWYAWQPYFLRLLGERLGRDPDSLVWVAGVIAAVMGLVLVAGGQLAAKMAGRVRRSTALAVAAAVFSLGMVATGISGSFWPAVVAFMVGMAGFSVVEPFRQAALHAAIPSRTRATVTSFNNLLGSAGGVVAQPALGAYTRAQGDVGPGYVVGGLLTAPAVLLALRFGRRGPVDADGRPVDPASEPRIP